MVTLTIDGKTVTAPEGATILEAARSAGIDIPTLCWLEKVSPTGACRICVVEIDGVDRTMTACNTQVKEGIVVTTQSPRLAGIRTKIMELMLVNHPLDCPVCDAGGECDLQDTCYGLSVTRQEYSARLERKPIRYDWRLLESDPNRCILCEKCVKVDHEIVGCDAIAVVNKGDDTIIDTRDGKPLDCDFCGNCIEACPTGTLISKPFKFRGRPWTFMKKEGVCPFCSVGCEIVWHVRDDGIGRVTSPDSTYNRGNLCINGRFGYTAFSSPGRLTTPRVKRNGVLVETTWDDALQTVVDSIGDIVARNGAGAVAGIGSARLTNEEQYLFQKYLRQVVKTPHLDSEAGFGLSRALEIVREVTGVTGSAGHLERIDRSSLIIVLGADLKSVATGFEYRVINGCTKHDARLITLTNRETRLRRFANVPLRYRPMEEGAAVAALLKGAVEKGMTDPTGTADTLPLSSAEYGNRAGLDPVLLAEAIDFMVSGGGGVSILYGPDCYRSVDAEPVMRMVAALASVTGAVGGGEGGIFPVDEKNNSLGMLEMGVSPVFAPGWQPAPERGKGIGEILDGIERGEIKALVVAGSDPIPSFPGGGDRLRRALERLELLVVLSSHDTATAQAAHVVLPAAAAPEKSGSFTTVDGRLQTFSAALSPPGGALPDFDILSRLIALSTRIPAAGIEGIRREIEDATGRLYQFAPETKRVPASAASVRASSPLPAFTGAKGAEMALLVTTSRYHNGTITTWSENNLTVDAAPAFVLSPEDATRIGVREGGEITVESSGGSVTGHVRISAELPPGLVTAPGNFPEFRVNALLTGSANAAPVTVRPR